VYLGVEIIIWVIFALAVNLLLGYTGLPPFGHGAFLGIGAYAFGLTQFNLIDNLWISLIGAVVITGAIGGVVALFLSHRRGIYFALMTIAFAQIFFFIASKWTDVTGGEDGLLNIARLPADFGVAAFDLSSNIELYYFCFAVYAVLVVLLWRLVHSPFGKVVRAIKQNESRVSFVGYNVYLYKWVVFTLSCALSGLAGALFAMAQEGAYPVLGVGLYFIARDILGAYTEAWLLWFGLMFVILVMFKPEGLAGIWQDLTRRYEGREPRRRLTLGTVLRR
jgi:branched-chain amino acid transport system permease protein